MSKTKIPSIIANTVYLAVRVLCIRLRTISSALFSIMNTMARAVWRRTPAAWQARRAAALDRLTAIRTMTPMVRSVLWRLLQVVSAIRWASLMMLCRDWPRKTPSEQDWPSRRPMRIRRSRAPARPRWSRAWPRRRAAPRRIRIPIRMTASAISPRSTAVLNYYWIENQFTCLSQRYGSEVFLWIMQSIWLFNIAP